MDALAPAPDATGLAPLSLELALHPDDAAAFWRAPALASWRQGRRVGGAPLLVIWHDTPERTLAAAGLLPAEQVLGARTCWRVEALHPGHRSPREAATVGGLGGLPDSLAPIGRFEGAERRLRRADGIGLAAVRVAHGTLRAGDAQRPACRVTLEGDIPEAYGLAHALAGSLRLIVPRLTLAGEMAELSGAAVGPAHLGAPVLPGDGTVDAALATLLGQLGAVLLHWARLAGPDAGPDPVHQMRVALRRLRSALKVFETVAGCPRLDAAREALRAFGQTLGAARDWDVFLAGLGRDVGAAFAGEPAIARMLRAAERQRRARYAELASALDGPEFRRLGLTLAELAATRPWRAWIPQDPAVAEQRAAALEGNVADFARHALHRRLRHATRAGRGFSRLDTEALHALRIQCKRLRYACELFAPAFPGHGAHRFLRRLARVQQLLGTLNDGAAAAGLMRSLGAGRGLASGLVRGFAAARDGHARADAALSWKRFRDCAPFWT